MTSVVRDVEILWLIRRAVVPVILMSGVRARASEFFSQTLTLAAVFGNAPARWPGLMRITDTAGPGLPFRAKRDAART